MKLIKSHKTDSGKKVYHLINDNPTLGTYGSYLLMKDLFKRLDKEKDWRYKVAFNIRFLRKTKRSDGKLQCSFCGKEGLKIETPLSKVPRSVLATVDHFIPTSKGGLEFDEINMVVSCSKCNSKKGNQIYHLSSLRFISIKKLFQIKNYLESFKPNHFKLFKNKTL